MPAYRNIISALKCQKRSPQTASNSPRLLQRCSFVIASVAKRTFGYLLRCGSRLTLQRMPVFQGFTLLAVHSFSFRGRIATLHLFLTVFPAVFPYSICRPSSLEPPVFSYIHKFHSFRRNCNVALPGEKTAGRCSASLHKSSYSPKLMLCTLSTFLSILLSADCPHLCPHSCLQIVSGLSSPTKLFLFP